MRYSNLKTSYLILYLLSGYAFLFLYAQKLNLHHIPEVLCLTLFIPIAAYFAFALPRSGATFTFLYPVYLLGILILGKLIIFPYFFGSLTFYTISHVRELQRRKNFHYYLVTLWSSVRMTPILVFGAFLYERLGGGNFYRVSETPLVPLAVLLFTLASLDYFSLNTYLNLRTGNPPWKLIIPFSSLFDLLFVPLAIPVFLLYEQDGTIILLLIALPVVGILWVAKKLFQEKSKKEELLELLTIANELVRSSLNRKELIKKIAQRVQELLAADGVEVFLKGEKDWDLEMSFGQSTLQAGSKPPDFLHSLKDLPVMHRDLRETSSFDDYKKRGIFSLLLIPLLSGESLIGSLVCSKSVPSYFFKEHLEFSKVLAGQMSLALQGADLHEKLVVALAELEKANQLKREFLANVSHELRGSLHAIMGYATLFLDQMNGPLLPAQEIDMKKLSRRADHLFRLTNDLLDLAKIEAGRMTMNIAELALEPKLQEIISDLQPSAQEKDLFLRQELPDSLPDVYVDPDRFAQVLLNLLGNAIKFTDHGGITVQAARTPTHVKIMVSDTGIGISKEDLPHVFEEFKQVGNESARAQGGTGLGLAIARQLVELQRGVIWADSKLGEGTTFTFTVPIARDSQASNL